MNAGAESISLSELVALCGAEPASGIEFGILIRGVGGLAEAEPDQISWIAEERRLSELPETRAAAVIGTRQLLGDFPRSLYVSDPENAIADILERFCQPRALSPGIHPTAVIDASASIGEGTSIGAHVVVGAGAIIGAGCRIHPGVSIGAGVRIADNTVLHDRTVIYDRCTIGSRVILHAGVVIGADGFGYIFRKGAHRKLAHLGTVVIEDDVEIGANATIDRGKLGATRIGRGTKIDNMVMIGHNAQIGPLCVIIAQCGIAGSANLGTGVTLAGHCGVVQGVHVGDGVRAGVKSVIQADIEPGKVLWGNPARDHMEEKRDRARVRMLPKLLDRVTSLEERLAQLEASAHHRKSG